MTRPLRSCGGRRLEEALRGGAPSSVNLRLAHSTGSTWNPWNASQPEGQDALEATRPNPARGCEEGRRRAGALDPPSPSCSWRPTSRQGWPHQDKPGAGLSRATTGLPHPPVSREP